MAKKGMNIRYKSRKRERNKYNPSEEEGLKSNIKVVVGAIIFFGLMYLLALGLGKLGLFEAGYTAPQGDTTTDYEYIPIGTVFNRSESEYFVLFDDYSTKISYDVYIETLANNSKTKVYKVDMGKKANAKYKGEKANPKATRAEDLSINGITLIKITNGKIRDYVQGSDKIEEYLK